MNTILGAVGVLLVLILVYRQLPSRRPRTLGVHAGRLADCPATPNCVCTQATDPEHRIEPIHFEGNPSTGFQRVQSTLATMPRLKVISAEFPYLHAEARTPLLQFIDDVEILVDEDSSTIHFRSASRVGHSDLGVNRERMEQFRRLFHQTPAGPPP